jgi:ABC-2 type transport system ATP-binding protein
LPEGLGAEAADDEGRYVIATDAPTAILHRLTGWAVEQGIELEELSVSRPSLEDLFVEIVGSSAQEGGDA